MLAFVITGHARFGTSMKESLELIAGEKSNFYALDFLGSEDANSYREKLENLIGDLCLEYEGVIVLTDLLGGTPFKLAAELSVSLDKVHVLSGTNLGLLLNSSLSQPNDNIYDFINQLLEDGKQQLFYFEID